MTDPIEIIANHTINWAAHLLVDYHGEHAPILAARCAAEEKQAGNDDLASNSKFLCFQVRSAVSMSSPAPTAVPPEPLAGDERWAGDDDLHLDDLDHDDLDDG